MEPGPHSAPPYQTVHQPSHHEQTILPSLLLHLPLKIFQRFPPSHQPEANHHPHPTNLNGLHSSLVQLLPKNPPILCLVRVPNPKLINLHLLLNLESPSRAKRVSPSHQRVVIHGQVDRAILMPTLFMRTSR